MRELAKVLCDRRPYFPKLLQAAWECGVPMGRHTVAGAAHIFHLTGRTEVADPGQEAPGIVVTGTPAQHWWEKCSVMVGDKGPGPVGSR
jgi:hypothetical protein